MSYSKITVKGQPVGLRFTWPAIKEFMLAAVDNEYYYSGEEMTALGTAKLFHCAYKMECAIKEQSPSLTLEDIYNYIEEAVDSNKEELAAAVTAFAQSRDTKLVLSKAQEITKKKTSPKATRKSKQPSTQAG